MADPAAPVGVGIDVEECGACAHLSPEALRRASARWLSAEERDWCAAQPSPAEALVVVLSCKEAAFKAWRGVPAVHEVRLAMSGSPARGRALAAEDAVRVDVEWSRWGGRIVALAVARASSARPE